MNKNYKKFFFDPRNYQQILKSISKITSRYNYTLQEEDQKKCIQLMKILSYNNKDIVNKNMRMQDLIYHLNTEVMNTMIEYIEEKQSKNNNLLRENRTENEEKRELPPGLLPEKIENDKEKVNKDLLEELKNRDYKTTEEPKLEPFTEDNLQDYNHKDENMIEKTKEQMVIKPKQKYTDMMQDIKDDRKYTSVYDLIIDSKDRNYDNYPEPNNYIIDLNTIYKDIISIELISTIVPRSQYIINNSNNTIHFNEGGDDLVATITEGNYTISTLMSALKTAMELVGGLTYTFTENTLTNKITISASGTYSLLFNGGTETYLDSTRTVYKENSIGSILGYKRTDLSGSTSYTGQNQYNINGENYLLMEIKDLENLNGSVVGNTIGNNFCKIILNVENNENKYFTNLQDYLCKKYFDPLLHKLSQLNIKFYTYNGSLYDFNGLEHSLHFRIKCINKNNQIIDLN